MGSRLCGFVSVAEINLKGIKKPKVAILYHYFYPDDVISARHFQELGEQLFLNGWEVEALPCNRSCRNEDKAYSLFDEWKGIKIRRIWRPGFKQSSIIGRVLNSVWMILAWSTIVFRRKTDLPEVIIIGTDPVLSVFVAPLIKFFKPNIKIDLWCHDLYPEAAVAEGFFKESSLWMRLLQKLVKFSYSQCDCIVDLGVCMRRRLEKYKLSCERKTLTPWALIEPERIEETKSNVRQYLFGEAKLGLLYSGNFGRAHSYEEFIDLARFLRGESIHFCFSVRGNQIGKLQSDIQRKDRNISFKDFASEKDLLQRLNAADIHLISLRSEWVGVVVPSKFFGSLAVGRPVLYAGPEDSSIALWIRKFNLGWVLTKDNIREIADELVELSKNKGKLNSLNQNAYHVYQSNFTKKKTMDEWEAILRNQIRL